MNTKTCTPRLPRITLILVVGLALVAAPAAVLAKSVRRTAPLAEIAPRRVGVSAERLGRIDAMCRKAVAAGDIPGVVALMKQTQGTTSDSTGWKFRLLVGQSVDD